MEQEERGEALLAVEGLQNTVLNIPVDEVEAEVAVRCGRLDDLVQEAVAEGRRLLVVTTLGDVALDDRDRDLPDRRTVPRRLVEESEERCRIALHACAPMARVSSRSRNGFTLSINLA